MFLGLEYLDNHPSQLLLLSMSLTYSLKHGITILRVYVLSLPIINFKFESIFLFLF